MFEEFFMCMPVCLKQYCQNMSAEFTVGLGRMCTLPVSRFFFHLHQMRVNRRWGLCLYHLPYLFARSLLAALLCLTEL